MRNSQERIGANKENASSPPPEALQEALNTGGDFSFMAVNDIIELPSKGEHLPEDHPLRVNPVIELKQMTAKEEDILVNQSYIKQGVVIDKLLHSLLVDKTTNLDDLLVGDKNALLIQSRISAYGAEYPVQTFCRACMQQQNVTFDLEECVNYREASYSEEAVQNENGTFTIEMPKSKVKLELRFLAASDEKALAAKEQKYKKHNVEFSTTIEAYRQMIVSVNGEEKLINKYLDNMPLQDSRYLKKIIKTVPPTAELIGEYDCQSCGAANKQEVPITYRFFWPDL